MMIFLALKRQNYEPSLALAAVLSHLSWTVMMVPRIAPVFRGNDDVSFNQDIGMFCGDKK